MPPLPVVRIAAVVLVALALACRPATERAAREGPPETLPPSPTPSPAEWVKAHARPIRSLTDTADYSDLEFLRPLLEGKRVVQLGESSHGVAEFSQAKVRLIRYLHEHLGYDVVAFESPLVDCTDSGLRARELTSRELLARCPWGVWRAREVLPLFDYVKATAAGPRPLRLAGMDVQTNASTAAAERPAFLADIVGRVDSAYARRVFTLDSTVVATERAGPARSRGVWSEAYASRIRAGYDTLARWLTEHDAELGRTVDRSHQLLARQAARAAARWDYNLRGAAVVPVPGTHTRDQGMAFNVEFLLDSLHPGRKIIVWAHNAHVRHAAGPSFAIGPSFEQGVRPMGSWLASARRPEIYTVGLYMHGGRTRMNEGEVVPVLPPEASSLEAMLHATGNDAAFLPLGAASDQRGSGWLRQPVDTWTWGRKRQPLVLADEYDAILFVDQVRPPVHLPREPASSCCPRTLRTAR